MYIKQKGEDMKIIDKIVLILIVIGAINWGLIGLFNLNLVSTIFGNMSLKKNLYYLQNKQRIKEEIRTIIRHVKLKTKKE